MQVPTQNLQTSVGAVSLNSIGSPGFYCREQLTSSKIDAINYLSKEYKGPMSKEISKFRCALSHISMSVRIACRSHPSFRVLDSILRENNKCIITFTTEIIDFLLYDNSISMIQQV